MSRATPFLTFQPPTTVGALEAMEHWTSLFEDGEVLGVVRRDDDASKVVTAEFVLAGQRFRCSDSPPVHEWGFSPAISIWLDVDGVDEQRRLATALAQGGREHMPLDDYGFGSFAWVEDRFGVSWQLGLIGPTG